MVYPTSRHTLKLAYNWLYGYTMPERRIPKFSILTQNPSVWKCPDPNTVFLTGCMHTGTSGPGATFAVLLFTHARIKTFYKNCVVSKKKSILPNVKTERLSASAGDRRTSGKTHKLQAILKRKATDLQGEGRRGLCPKPILDRMPDRMPDKLPDSVRICSKRICHSDCQDVCHRGG